ncbi:hypothetical protein J2Z48_001564 [Croceifilum oryzae]|uniref:Uncharacterized protein n=1 Tax=Croceifilum oryzae TaxID=1553429 RepID=A0AAJ1TMM5_9BACL|nr:hypothetical protein [Croceifilum oryzae]MDQ0417391.1 hypothetical protein [Croceifilum oryzae]
MNPLMQLLDKKADEFDFPILDNANVDLAQTRLSIFKDNDNWLMTFEMVGYFIPGQDFASGLYAYSNNLNHNGLSRIFEEVISSFDQGQSFIDDNGSFLLSPFERICFKIWEDTYCFTPTSDDYLHAGLDPKEFSPTTFVRLISSLYKDKLWLDDDLIFSSLSLKPMPLFFRTDEWNHDDIQPSEHLFFQQVAQALEKNDATLIHIKDPNTHWSNWETSITEIDY